MEQNLGGNGSRAGVGNQPGSEDASEAREHARNAEENRDALEAQSRRVEATEPPELRDQPREGTGGMSAGGAGQGSEDASRAREHARDAEENRDALEAQNRRVEETAPDSTREDLRSR
jgi:hypothetical protein